MLDNAVVPVFKLYGETRHWPTPDLLHCESIPERSRLHDWRIRPHRHTDLVHVLCIAGGSVVWDLEGTSYDLDGPCVIVIPIMTIHGFQFSCDVQGHILTFAKPLAERFGRDISCRNVLTQARTHVFNDDMQRHRIATLIGQIDDEYRRPAVGRQPLLEALAQALVIQLSRLMPATSPKVQALGPRQRDTSARYMVRFQRLIERHFREQPSVRSLATELGISSAHLNLLCRKTVGQSALALVHERTLLEAKRQLIYTNMTVAQVSDALGFSEPAYFTRFFKRHTRLSPRAFRLSHLQQEVGREDGESDE